MHAKPAGIERAQKTGQNLLKVISETSPVKIDWNQENEKTSHRQEKIFAKDISDVGLSS